MKKNKRLSFLFELISSIFYNCWAYSLLKDDFSFMEMSKYLGIFLLTIAVFQIPTGYLSDKLKHKVIIYTGLVLIVISSTLLYIKLDPLFPFLVLGLAFSCIDGSKQAWLRQTSDQGNFSSDVKSSKYYFSLDLFSRFGAISGTVIGLFVTHQNPKYTWALLLLISVFTLFVISKDRRKILVANSHNNELLLPKKLTLGLTLFFIGTIFFGLETGLRSLAVQPYLVDLTNDSPLMMSVIMFFVFCSRVLGIFSFKLSPEKLKQLVPVIILFTGVLFSIGDINASSAMSITSFLVPYCLGIWGLGILFPLLETTLNSFVPESRRATMTSVNSMIYYLAGGCSLLYLSTDNLITPRSSWLIAGTSFLIATVVYTFSSLKSKREQSAAI